MSDVAHTEELIQNQLMALGDLWKNASGTYQTMAVTGFQGAEWQYLGLNAVMSSLCSQFSATSSQAEDCSQLLVRHEYSSFSLRVIKFQMLSLLLDLNERAVIYEPIKD